MAYNEKDDEYNYYRNLHLKHLSKNEFPWGSAYYYYMQNIDRIDVMSFTDFQDDLLAINRTGVNVTDPICSTLNEYFDVRTLLSANDEVIKLF